MKIIYRYEIAGQAMDGLHWCANMYFNSQCGSYHFYIDDLSQYYEEGLFGGLVLTLRKDSGHYDQDFS